MKKLNFIVLFTIVASLVQAQISNSGFESWTSVGSYEIPDQWGNMNPATAPSGVYTTLKGSPGATGNYFIKLTTKDVGGVITPGIIVSGQLNTSTWKPESGFSFNQRVENLIGKYQFMGYGNDVATISAWLTKWNTTLHRRDTIASLVRNTSGMLHVWTGFSIPFAYQSVQTPDTAVVMISSSSTTPVKNSFIWLDDLGFEGIATAVSDEKSLGDIAVYPSPASDQVNIGFTSKKNSNARLNIIDILGNTIYRSVVEITTGSNLLHINLGIIQPPNGVYFVHLETPDGLFTQKFIIGL
jgi:hypothetical protein